LSRSPGDRNPGSFVFFPFAHCLDAIEIDFDPFRQALYRFPCRHCKFAFHAFPLQKYVNGGSHLIPISGLFFSSFKSFPNRFIAGESFSRRILSRLLLPFSFPHAPSTFMHYARRDEDVTFLGPASGVTSIASSTCDVCSALSSGCSKSVVVLLFSSFLKVSSPLILGSKIIGRIALPSLRALLHTDFPGETSL